MPTPEATAKYEKLKPRIEQAIATFNRIGDALDSGKASDVANSDRLRAQHKKVAQQIVSLRKRIAALQKEGIYDFGAIGGDGMEEIDGEFAEEVVVDTSKFGKARDWHDPTFKKAFSDSIAQWCGNARDDLQDARLAMLKMSSSSGPKPTDLLPVLDLVAIAVPGWGTAIKVASALTKLGYSAYTAAIKTKSPSVVEIADAAIAYVKAIENGDHGPAFNELVAGMKARGYEGDTVWEGQFLPECKDFTKKYFGSPQIITKQFLAKCIAATEDGMDWDGGRAGFADCWMTGIGGDSPDHFGSPGGQLDDVHEGLVTAVKSVWKGSRVIDLPVDIRITVKTHMGAYKTVIERSSKTPGDTSFRMTSGTRSMFDAFMKGRFYEQIMVSHLTVDT